MKEIEIVFDTEKLADYLFTNLIKRGFVPSEEELDEISDVVFDYLIQLGVMDEEI